MTANSSIRYKSKKSLQTVYNWQISILLAVKHRNLGTVNQDAALPLMKFLPLSLHCAEKSTLLCKKNHYSVQDVTSNTYLLFVCIVHNREQFWCTSVTFIYACILSFKQFRNKSKYTFFKELIIYQKTTISFKW